MSIWQAPGQQPPPRLVLGIETSCDETGVALLELTANGGRPQGRLLGQALHSQIQLHKEYGGVVPELASRDHLLRLLPLINDCLQQAGEDLSALDLIGVTEGPGLAGALLVGVSLAHGLATGLGKPIMGIHHLEGHLLSPLFDAEAAGLGFPFLALLVSGGHTQLMAVEALGRYRLLGETIDDAAGEAFDKSAQLMGMGYPGGPAISAWAESGDPTAFALPRPLKAKPGLDFSFAGLKTAVLTQLSKQPALTDRVKADMAASLQAAIVDVLASRAERALVETGLPTLVVAGGVSANKALRAKLQSVADRLGRRVLFPPPALCTDNGVMIAWAAGLRAWAGHLPQAKGRLIARPRWPLDQLSIAG